MRGGLGGQCDRLSLLTMVGAVEAKNGPEGAVGRPAQQVAPLLRVVVAAAVRVHVRLEVVDACPPPSQSTNEANSLDCNLIDVRLLCPFDQ